MGRVLMNFRVSTILGFALIALSAFGIYLVKYRVQDLQAELATLQREIAAEHEAMHLLRAEWAYLSQPKRLAALQQKYLKMAPVCSAQTLPVSHAFLPQDSMTQNAIHAVSVEAR